MVNVHILTFNNLNLMLDNWRAPKRRINHEGEVAVGMICITDVLHYWCTDFPQIGWIIEVEAEDCTIHWFSGSFTGRWIEATRLVNRERL